MTVEVLRPLVEGLVVREERLEHRSELVAVRIAERREKGCLSVIRRARSALERLPACRCQDDDVASTIGRVGATPDEALALEAIEQHDHRRAVDREALSRLQLRRWLAVGQNRQDRELTTVDAEWLEPGGIQNGHPLPGVLQEIPEPVANGLQVVVVGCHVEIVPDRRVPLMISYTDDQLGGL